MRLMYEFPGQISEDKSLIRHRVFMTRLKEGAEEEYKHRHDVLAQNQSKQPDAGPALYLVRRWIYFRLRRNSYNTGNTYLPWDVSAAGMAKCWRLCPGSLMTRLATNIRKIAHYN